MGARSGFLVEDTRFTHMHASPPNAVWRDIWRYANVAFAGQEKLGEWILDRFRPKIYF